MSQSTKEPNTIDLRSSLSLRNSWAFPLQSKASRREIWIGGLWLLVPVFGWLMNMGHRIIIVHHMHNGKPIWPAWNQPRELLKHGIYTFAGMVWYGWPGVTLMCLGWFYALWWLLGVGVVLWILAVIAIPGYMTHYCRELDPREIFDPLRALSRVKQGGTAYWKAWMIVFPTMLVSFVGLLGFGIGFVFTSVWFWQVAAFSFATVFTQRFDLDANEK